MTFKMFGVRWPLLLSEHFLTYNIKCFRVVWDSGACMSHVRIHWLSPGYYFSLSLFSFLWFTLLQCKFREMESNAKRNGFSMIRVTSFCLIMPILSTLVIMKNTIHIWVNIHVNIVWTYLNKPIWSNLILNTSTDLIWCCITGR